jgi:tight adherence protein B
LIDVSRVFLDWWSFQVSEQGHPKKSSDQSAQFRSVFSTRSGRVIYVLIVFISVFGLAKLSLTLSSLVTAAGFGLPIALRIRRNLTHRLAMEQALPDAMTRLVTLLSAGQPLHQAIVDLPERVDPVLAPCFSQLRADLKIGIGLSDALKRQERRLDLDEFVAFASCVRVGLLSGGTLSPSIERLAGDMRKRINLRMKLRVLTVQARGQAWIMAALPALILLALSIVDPSGFQFLVQTNAGRTALSIAISMNLMGALWVRRLSKSKWV